MARRSWIASLIVGLAACGLPGCFRGYVFGPDASSTAPRPAADKPSNPGSPYHAGPPPPAPDHGPAQPLQPTGFSGVPPPGGFAPTVKVEEPPPPPPDPPPAEAVRADKAPPEPPLVTALRDLLQNRAGDALERLKGYDAVSRELLLTLLPLAARIGDGGLDHASPQETAVLLEQVRQVEAVLRPRAALALDKVCLCRTIKGFGDCEPWPEGRAFRPASGDYYGEPMQVYVEVRNFTCRPHGPEFDTSLAGVLEICDFKDPKYPVVRLDFPAKVDRSRTPREDYFVNFGFYLPRLPEGRYTLRVTVKDVLSPSADDAPRSASRSLDFRVGGPGRD
jgi:hypothetical protein